MSGESIACGAPAVLKGVEDDGLEGIGDYDDPRIAGVNLDAGRGTVHRQADAPHL